MLKGFLKKQKRDERAELPYLLFLGCTIPRRLPFIEAASRYVLKNLGIEIEESSEFSCCPDPTLKLTMNPKTYYAIAARNLCIAQKQNLPILTLCNGCYYTLKNTADALKDEKVRSNVNKILSKIGMEYSNQVTVRHVAYVLHENIPTIKANVKYALKNVQIAVHNGCHILPTEDVKTIPNLTRLRVIDDVVEAIGAKSVEYPTKQECCGGNLKGISEKIALQMMYEKLMDLKNTKCDCITTQCPFCYINFDMRHSFIEKLYGEVPRIPTLTLVELLALSLGYKPEDIGIKYHITPCNGFLKKFGF